MPIYVVIGKTDVGFTLITTIKIRGRPTQNILLQSLTQCVNTRGAKSQYV